MHQSESSFQEVVRLLPLNATQLVRRHVMQGLLLGTLAAFGGPLMAKEVIRVGPNSAIKSIAAAAAAAKDGDVFEVEAGDYPGDVAVWTKDNITVRAVGGRVRLAASGMAAEGKAIWVVRGGHMTVEGFDFSGAQVSGKNGAGIRFEQGTLLVKDCSFLKNENGILTSNNKQAVLEIENSEFGFNGYGDGQSHNIYAGEIARLAVSGSYFHHAKVGHLLKSRAAVNLIYYNRLTDEVGGTASYELEFAAGGVAHVVGNIIQQGSQTQNPHLISYAAEGYKWPKNELVLINNTLVDNRPHGGVFLRVKPGGNASVKAVNNLLVGKGTLDSAAPGDYRNNFNVDWDVFELAARDDYRLKHGSKLIGKAIDPGPLGVEPLMSAGEYVHPRKTRTLKGPLRQPGALQSHKS